MIEGYSPVMQAFLGTLITWGLTAAGAALVIFVKGSQRKLLDASLGFAAGVMTAASFWSLLAPAIEQASESKLYGEKGEYAFVPVAFGFLLGALFVYGADRLISVLGIHSPNIMLDASSWRGGVLYLLGSTSVPELIIHWAFHYGRFLHKKIHFPGPTLIDASDSFEFHRSVSVQAINATSSRKDSRRSSARHESHYSLPDSTAIDGFTEAGGALHQRRRVGKTTDNVPRNTEETVSTQSYDEACNLEEIQHGQWKRIILLVVAITVHNIPEGLAVGVGFGAIGTSPSATLEKARNLAIGIGIQNFPEGLAVSLPLQSAGFSTWKSLWYGQLSGMVEPIFGVLGAVAVGLAEPALPYALAFAAGAMIYVVVDDIIPEANTNGNGKLATWGAILGFLVMMTLDVGLG